MAIQSKFKSNREVRDEGVWVPMPGSDSGSRLKLRSEDYAPYRKAISKAIQGQQGRVGPYTRRVQQDQIIDTLAFDKSRGEAIAKHLLVDWDIKIEDMNDDGQVVAFSTDVASKLLVDPDYYDLFLAVVEAVTTLTSDKSEWESDRKKSSAPVSPTT